MKHWSRAIIASVLLFAVSLAIALYVPPPAGFTGFAVMAVIGGFYATRKLKPIAAVVLAAIVGVLMFASIPASARLGLDPCSHYPQPTYCR